MSLSCKIYFSTPGGFTKYVTTTVRNKFVWATPAVIALRCTPDLTVGTVATELGNMNEMGVIGSWCGKSQAVACSHQRQNGNSYDNGQQNQGNNQSSMTHANLWCWLVNDCVLRSKIYRKPTKYYLICISKNVVGQMNTNWT